MPDIGADLQSAYEEGFHAGYDQAMSEMPEIIRCKDCKNSECVGRFGDIVCGRTGTPHRPEWYCPCGEPKDKP